MKQRTMWGEGGRMPEMELKSTRYSILYPQGTGLGPFPSSILKVPGKRQPGGQTNKLEEREKDCRMVDWQATV
jgi:hypothetical protein